MKEAMRLNARLLRTFARLNVDVGDALTETGVALRKFIAALNKASQKGGRQEWERSEAMITTVQFDLGNDNKLKLEMCGNGNLSVGIQIQDQKLEWQVVTPEMARMMLPFIEKVAKQSDA